MKRDIHMKNRKGTREMEVPPPPNYCTWEAFSQKKTHEQEPDAPLSSSLNSSVSQIIDVVGSDIESIDLNLPGHEVEDFSPKDELFMNSIINSKNNVKTISSVAPEKFQHAGQYSPENVAESLLDSNSKNPDNLMVHMEKLVLEQKNVTTSEKKGKRSKSSEKTCSEYLQSEGTPFNHDERRHKKRNKIKIRKESEVYSSNEDPSASIGHREVSHECVPGETAIKVVENEEISYNHDEKRHKKSKKSRKEKETEVHSSNKDPSTSSVHRHVSHENVSGETIIEGLKNEEISSNHDAKRHKKSIKSRKNKETEVNSANEDPSTSIGHREVSHEYIPGETAIKVVENEEISSNHDAKRHKKSKKSRKNEETEVNSTNEDTATSTVHRQVSHENVSGETVIEVIQNEEISSNHDVKRPKKSKKSRKNKETEVNSTNEDPSTSTVHREVPLENVPGETLIEVLDYDEISSNHDAKRHKKSKKSRKKKETEVNSCNEDPSTSTLHREVSRETFIKLLGKEEVSPNIDAKKHKKSKKSRKNKETEVYSSNEDPSASIGHREVSHEYVPGETAIKVVENEEISSNHDEKRHKKSKKSRKEKETEVYSSNKDPSTSTVHRDVSHGNVSGETLIEVLDYDETSSNHDAKRHKKSKKSRKKKETELYTSNQDPLTSTVHREASHENVSGETCIEVLEYDETSSNHDAKRHKKSKKTTIESSNEDCTTSNLCEKVTSVNMPFECNGTHKPKKHKRSKKERKSEDSFLEEEDKYYGLSSQSVNSEACKTIDEDDKCYPKKRAVSRNFNSSKMVFAACDKALKTTLDCNEKCAKPSSPDWHDVGEGYHHQRKKKRRQKNEKKNGYQQDCQDEIVAKPSSLALITRGFSKGSPEDSHNKGVKRKKCKKELEMQEESLDLDLEESMSFESKTLDSTNVNRHKKKRKVFDHQYFGVQQESTNISHEIINSAETSTWHRLSRDSNGVFSLAAEEFSPEEFPTSSTQGKRTTLRSPTEMETEEARNTIGRKSFLETQESSVEQKLGEHQFGVTRQLSESFGDSSENETLVQGRGNMKGLTQKLPSVTILPPGCRNNDTSPKSCINHHHDLLNNHTTQETNNDNLTFDGSESSQAESPSTQNGEVDARVQNVTNAAVNDGADSSDYLSESSCCSKSDGKDKSNAGSNTENALKIALKQRFASRRSSSSSLDEKDKDDFVDKKAKKRKDKIQKKHRCTRCRSYFPSVSEMMRHDCRLVRKTSKPWAKAKSKAAFKCDSCRRSYTQKSHLNHHVRTTHLGLRAYKCDVCEMSFGEKQTLVVHARIHTNSFPYECSFCGQEFKTTSHVHRHYRNFHNLVQSHACSFCPASYFLETDLKVHINSVHEKKTVQIVKNLDSGQCRKFLL